jgi:2-polyprenyl-3-methyl-5-hydroxy-6-metoxy-1,4-benzoquinol methylase
MEKYRKTNNLLDIGCGIGYFLEEAQKRGWNVYGTEYTDEAIKICQSKGFKMQQGKLNPENYTEVSFDVVTSFEVIEHINNPIEEVQNINNVLRDDGLFYFTTPNFNSFSRNLMKSSWSVICYPEHLSYYTPKTINRFLARNGFNKSRLMCTGISLTRYKKTVKKDNQALISANSDDELLRQKVETKWHFALAKKAINTVLTILGKGDTIKGLFIKS